MNPSLPYWQPRNYFAACITCSPVILLLLLWTSTLHWEPFVNEFAEDYTRRVKTQTQKVAIVTSLLVSCLIFIDFSDISSEIFGQFVRDTYPGSVL
jgi:succinate dehydrogenase hydrophobic anchor subunit